MIPVVPRDGRAFPVSCAQERLWYLQQLEPDSRNYVYQYSWRLKGSLDVDTLQRALDAIGCRHEILRTHFEWEDGGVVQVVGPPCPMPMDLHDLRGLADPELAACTRAIHDRERARSMAVDRRPLLRVTLLRLDHEAWMLVFTAHHLIADGWSLGLFLDELSRLYDEGAGGPGAALPDLRVQYLDFTMWQRQQLERKQWDPQLTYWARHLEGALADGDLSLGHGPPATTAGGACEVTARVSASLSAEIRAFSRRARVTTFMTMLAAFATLVHRHTGEPELVVGTPVAGRTHVDLERLIGLFVNTVAIRIHLGEDPSFRSLLAQVRRSVLGAWAHQEVPFEQVVRALCPERSSSQVPLFQVVFALQTTAPGAFTLRGLQTRFVPGEGVASEFAVRCEVTDGWSQRIDLQCRDQPRERVEELLARYQGLLWNAIREPDRRIGALPMSPAGERELRTL